MSHFLDSGAALLGAVAAGILTRDELSKAILLEWEEFARNDEAEAPGLMGWETEFYGRFIRPGHRVLVVGCGSGRDVVPLVGAGIHMTGLDLAPQAVERCRRNLERRGLSAELYAGSVETACLGRRFDRIIFSWFCYSYLPESGTRVLALQNAARHLETGGQVLLSYLLRDESESNRTQCQYLAARLSARLSRSAWHPELGDDFWFWGPLTQRLLRYEHRFTAGEIEVEARKAGLTVRFHEQRRHGVAMLEPV